MWILHALVHYVGLVVLVLAAVFCMATGLYTAGMDGSQGCKPNSMHAVPVQRHVS
jgi:hypothetical protein